MSRLEAIFPVTAAYTFTATNAGGGPTAVTMTAGNYTPTSFLTMMIARCNAVRTGGTWSGSISYTTGLVTLNCSGGAWAGTFTTAELGTLLGFVGDIGSGSVAVTGTQNTRGLWLPGYPTFTQSDPISAPEQTDTRAVETPTGDTQTLGGSCKYVHRGVRWSHVERARVHEGAATTTYASFQQWLRDTQWGRGHSWFSPGSKCQVYWSNGETPAIVGSDLNAGAGPTNGWSIAPAVSSLEQVVKRVDESWTGMLSVSIERLTSDG